MTTLDPSATTNRTVFGVGCLQIVPVDDWSEITRSKFVERLEKTLNSLPQVKKLAIRKTIDFREDDPPLDVVLGDLSQNKFPFAYGKINHDIEFSLDIPQRFQNELDYINSIDDRIGSETFHVSIKYNYYLPICFIWTESRLSRASSQDVFFIARRFLEYSLASSDFRVDILGPSPFHTQFYIEKRTVEDQTISEENEEVTFYVDDHSENDRIFVFLYRYFEKYYRNVIFKNHIHRHWSDLQSAYSDAIIMLEQRRFRDSIGKRQINKLLILAAKFEQYFDDRISEMSSGLAKIEECGIDNIVLQTKEDIAEVKNFSVASIMTFTDLLEKRRIADKTIIYALIAAIIGGVVGAAFTSYSSAPISSLPTKTTPAN